MRAAPSLLFALPTTILLLTVPLASPAAAQSGWNRTVRAFSVTPDPSGSTLWDVTAVVDVHLTDSMSAPLDLSLDLDLVVNGTVVATHTIPVGTDPDVASCPDGSGCGGSCGSGHVNGVSASLLCTPAGPCDPICDCHCAFPPIVSGFPGEPLAPGDEIMVILRPAPGAVPDPDTGDDFRVATFAGTPIAWDHRIDGVELTPSSAGTGLWDITIDGLVQFREMNAFADPRTGTVPLGFELELVVSGVSRSTQWIPFDPVPTGACGCGETCGSHNGFPLVCLLGHGGWCSCSWSWLTTIPGEPLSPGDEIMVILRPAPGALPELPGFQDEDEQRADCCPGVTGVAARVPTATRRLRANQPNPFADATTIEYVAGSDSRVTLEVFDVRGRRVTTLVDGTDRKADEIRRVVWSGHSDGGGQVPPGTYFLRLTSDGRSETRKMTVTR